MQTKTTHWIRKKRAHETGCLYGRNHHQLGPSCWTVLYGDVHSFTHVRPVFLNLVGGTGPHKFHTCIHRTLRSWKNKMSVMKFIDFYTESDTIEQKESFWHGSCKK